MLIIDRSIRILLFENGKVRLIHPNQLPCSIGKFNQGLGTLGKELGIDEGRFRGEENRRSIVGDLSKNKESAGQNEIRKACENYRADTVLHLALRGSRLKGVCRWRFFRHVRDV